MPEFLGRRENLVRAVMPGVEFREANNADDGSIGTLHGHFSKFNTWTEIRSSWEGHFLERIAPGAFRKTIAENRDNIKVLYNHGQDPTIGQKPLGPLADIREDDQGAYYEVPLLDTSYNRDLIPALKAGLLGASFRFQVVREDFNKKPERGDHNPDGLPERTVREVKLAELGPVTFPAYKDATAGVRSLTDALFVRQLMEEDPAHLRDLLLSFLPVAAEQGDGEAMPPAENRAEPQAHPVVARRPNGPLFGLNKETPTWRI